MRVEKTQKTRRNVEKAAYFFDAEQQKTVGQLSYNWPAKRRVVPKKMWVAAEEFLLINFVMDFLILYLASRGTWFFCLGRLTLSAFFASSYALADAHFAFRGWADGLAFFLSTLIAFPVRNGRMYMKSVGLVVMGLMIFGSVVHLFLIRGGSTLLSGVLGAGAAAGVVSFSKALLIRAGNQNQARFRVKYGPVRAEFTAIIDTGNLLTEPISALPVLIADEKALGKRFLSYALTNGRVRMAAYASVGGDGQMACLRADDMQVNVTGKWMKAPDLWLGLYPGVMRGSVHALSPDVALQGFGRTRKGTEGEL